MHRTGRSVGAVAVALLLGATVAACGGAASAPPVASSGAAAYPNPTVTPPSSGAVDPGQPAELVVDAGLLRILPAAVAGVALKASPDSAADMIKDPSLAASASAIAVAMVAAPGNSRGDDLAVSTVIKLRPGVYSDTFYSGWRNAYDSAACDPAGGVASHVQRLIGPHTVDVTVCAQGARTYHTHLAGDVLVSITAVGDGRFGDLVMAGLRE
jgi:hypothetical protein